MGPPIGPHLMTWQVKELSLNLGVVSMYEFFEKLGYAVIGKVSYPRSTQCPSSHAIQCPVPSGAQCPVPSARCPVPGAQCCTSAQCPVPNVISVSSAH
jgi:hypothetical protein